MRLKRDLTPTNQQLYDQSVNKRVRREYPWRNEYIRDFAVRPVQRDELTQAVVLIECSFCVAFGREERPVLNATPTTTVDGKVESIKSRARTRNVAHWKYPFRTDNIRSHHQQQHSTKWKEYVELMEMVKQEQLAIGTHGEAVSTPCRDRLDAFFGINTASSVVEQAPLRQTDRHVVADILSTTAAIHASSALSRHPLLLLGSSPSTEHKQLTVEISNTTMVEHLVHLLYSHPFPCTFLNRTSSKRLKSSSSSSPLTLEIPHMLQFQLVLQLASRGLSSTQIASIAPLFSLPELLSIDQVISNGEAIVIWSLDQISTRMQAAWTYALSFYVKEMNPEHVLIQMSLCIASNDVGKRDLVEEYHLVAVVLPSQDPEDRVASFLQVVLTAMDRQWMSKLLGVRVYGEVQCLVGTDHEDLVSQVVKDHVHHGPNPFYWTSTSLESIETALQSAWTRTYKQLVLQEDTRVFLSDLEALVVSLRHGTTREWRRTHGECPVLVRYNLWSVHQALQWIIGHKEVVQSTSIYGCPVLSTTWWLVAHVLMDMLALCEGHHTTTTPSSNEKVVLADVLVALKAKCGIRQLPTSLMDMSFDSTTSTWQYKTWTWTSEEMIACLRSLNLSTRRLYQEITGTSDEDGPSPRTKTHPVKTILKTPIATTRVETLTAHVVLVMAAALQHEYSSLCDRENQMENVLYVPPPSTPLAFAQLGLHEPTKASAAVDFVEFHSKRLELSFPTGFLDTITREIQELSALVAQDPALESQLMEMAPSWAPVPQFTALRTLAAGLSTVQPSLEHPKEFQSLLRGALALMTTEGLDVRSTFGDLGLEMTLHAVQFERLMQQHKEEEVIGV